MIVDQTIAGVGQRLLEVIVGLRHLARNLPDAVHLCLLPGRTTKTIPNVSAVQHVVAIAFARLDVDLVKFQDDIAGLSSIELFMSRQISESLDSGYDLFSTTSQCIQFEQLAATFDLSFLDVGLSLVAAPAEPGLLLATYAASQHHSSVVVLVLPCGMPFDLCRSWFNLLSQHFFVVTWETRGLFGRCDHFDDIGVSISDQVGDLFAILDRLSIGQAHLMGVCGGAVIALAAAAESPSRVLSLSLWYGDYNISNNAVRTQHQQNFEWLMETASRSREQAADLYAMFTEQSTIATIPEQIAHLTLYPYVNPELMFRYAKINDALNKVDSLSFLEHVRVPTLVVTGDSDKTTHSDGSRLVALSIAGAVLRVEVGGSHQKFFDLPLMSREVAVQFIASTITGNESKVPFKPVF